MQASTILQRCLGDSLAAMHGHRRRALLLAVEALIAGRRLTLIDLARAWPGAERVRAPLKRLDRLLSNGHVAVAAQDLVKAMAGHLLRGSRPVIVVDWADLKGDGRWYLLRAAVPVGGRSLTLYEQVFAQSKQNTPAAQRQFLQRLKALVPDEVRPIVVTDAGFRSDWYRAVDKLGWFYVGRVRGNVRVCKLEGNWQACQACYTAATEQPQDLGIHEMVRTKPWRCRLMLQRRAKRGRRRLTRRGTPSRDQRHLQAAQAAREPWLLAVSPSLTQHFTVRQVMALYAQRMQIEEAFRDLKSHRFGVGFEDSLTRKPQRLAILLLLHMLASFATWIAGHLAEQGGLARRLMPNSSRRRQYSLLRLGREALARAWLNSLPAFHPPDIPIPLYGSEQ
jgi:hypothetical protein